MDIEVVNQKGKAMQVETFECSETAAEPIEATEEAVRLMRELGLDGQLGLVTRNDKTERDDRCPYRIMAADEAFVYGVLCPQVSDLSEYSASPIPLRVLQVAAHAQSLGVFAKIVVWDRASATVHDPVLVGVRKERPAGWNWDREVNYILARWGEHLDEMPALVSKAVAIMRVKLIDGAKSARDEADAAIRKIESASAESVVSLGPTAHYILSTPNWR